jgi:hypothetical protein
MPDEKMDLVEPYKYTALGKFRSKYLSGFQAEIYDENKEELLPRAQKKAKKYTEGYLDEYNNSYSSVKTAIKKVDSKEMNSYYTFLPVWRYVYRYQGTNYEFFVNGQTGSNRNAADQQGENVLMVCSSYIFAVLSCGNDSVFSGGGINGENLETNFNRNRYTRCDYRHRGKVA